MSAASFEPSGEDGPGDPEVLEEKRIVLASIGVRSSRTTFSIRASFK